MMSYKYYIINLCDGETTRTDDKEVAENHAENEDYVVIDREEDKLLVCQNLIDIPVDGEEVEEEEED